MIDPMRRLKALEIENKALKEQLDKTRGELADSVRAEIELGVEIGRLNSVIAKLKVESETESSDKTVSKQGVSHE